MKRCLNLKGWKYLVLLVFLGLGWVSGLHAAVDMQITPWTPPPWSTPDIYADNDGDGVQECGEPRRGVVNRVFANVRNQGSTAATNVSVQFLYTPFGAGLPDVYFKEIGVLNISQVLPGETKNISMDWDLTDNTENNGGLWPGGLLSYDHFCVRVVITATGDSNPANNNAQSNFTEVPCSACGFNFLIGNLYDTQAHATLDIRGLPRGWDIIMKAKGIENFKEFTLGPKEVRMVRVELAHGENLPYPTSTVDVGLRLNGNPAGGISFKPVKTAAKKSPFSSSLHVGTAIPLGDTNLYLNPGPAFIMDSGYRLGNSPFSLVLYLGYSVFKSELSSVPDPRWWNLSANLKAELKLAPKFNFYLNAGPGVYHRVQKNSSSETFMGFNAGAGINFALSSSIKLELGSDYHRTLVSDAVEYMVTHIGFIYSY